MTHDVVEQVEGEQAAGRASLGLLVFSLCEETRSSVRAASS